MTEMDKHYIEQGEIVHKYVHGALLEHEAEAFEIYLMDHPEWVEDVQSEQLLKRKLADIPPNRFHASTKRRHTSLLWAGFGSAFATAATCVLGIYLYFNSALVPPQHGGTAQIAYLEQMRSPVSSDRGFNVTLAPQTRHIVMVLTPAVPLASSYEIFLMDEANPVAGPFRAAPNDMQEISISMPVELLLKEHYTLSVQSKQSKDVELIRIKVNRS